MVPGWILCLLIAFTANAIDQPSKINIAPRRGFEGTEDEYSYYEDTDEPVTPLPSRFCEDKRDGLYADIYSNCRRFHYCQTWKLPYGERKVDWHFECPETTLFNQEHLTCVQEYFFKDCQDSEQWFDKDQIIPELPPTDDNVPTIPDIPEGSRPIPEPDRPQRPPRPPTTQRPRPTTTKRPKPPTTQRPMPTTTHRPEPPSIEESDDNNSSPERPQGSEPFPQIPGDSNPIPDLSGNLPIPGFPNPDDFLSLKPVKFPVSDDKDAVEIRNPELLPTVPQAQNVLPTLQSRQFPLVLNPFFSFSTPSEIDKFFKTMEKLPSFELNHLAKSYEKDQKRPEERNKSENTPEFRQSELTGYLPHYPPFIFKDLAKPRFGIGGKPLEGDEKKEAASEKNFFGTGDKSLQKEDKPLMPLELSQERTKTAEIGTRPEVKSKRINEDKNRIWSYAFSHEDLDNPTRISLYDSNYRTHVVLPGLFRQWDGNPLLFPPPPSDW